MTFHSHSDNHSGGGNHIFQLLYNTKMIYKQNVNDENILKHLCKHTLGK